MQLVDLPKPFFVLAPMDDVTDTVFRQTVADCASPDLFFTEFVNVDGLQSPGRPKLFRKLKFVASEKSLVAHIWGLKPENFYKTAIEIADGSLAEELAWYARRSGLDEVLGGKEKRASRTSSTVSESRTQPTTQFAESVDRVGGFADKRGSAAWTPGANFVGIDLNMGCPAKGEVKAGACSALINNRTLASEIIKATQEGASGKLPVSVKTRLGFSEVDMSWPEFLLGHNLAMLSMHCRTRKDMSKVPARLELMDEIGSLRDKLAPDTLIVANGDVASRSEGLALAKKYKLDGIMIGRGIFNDPFCFAQASSFETFTELQRVELYKKQVQLFAKTWQPGERNIQTLNKFCKVYISGFDGAKELREQLMKTQNTSELLALLEEAKSSL